MTTLRELLGGLRVIPVVVVESAGAARPLAAALADGGLPCAEVTLRTPAALEALHAMAAEPGMLVGAGSVVTPHQVDQAVDAGARFVVSPGLSDAVLSRCRALRVPALPGVATAGEIMHALEVGIDLVKLFPAAQLGGPAGVRSLAGPFPTVRFVPTGGIGPGNLAAYLTLDAVAAVGGSWLVAPELVRGGRFDEIRRLTRSAVTIAGQLTREGRPA
jgi:2-dehydro-3-deoxyphosphogluconate aldolase/(4S)-4-hydroxy-2-oxoglutarate aldolase